ncbi:tyrosine-protein phosphatase [Streptomyces sp. RGM 3693]|uniref:tyrosine-protein phosphatase n=1 Tax=Streptomyces sp. RGM 3693 TaxID=3413284 RepID=UPI003D27ECE3
MVTINTFPVRRPALRLLVAATGLGVLATGAVGCSARPAQDSPGGRSSSAAQAAAPTPRSMGLRDAPNARDPQGKDRTGWMSAVLLTAAGVPRATVDQDYLASNHYLQASNDRQMAQLRAAGKVKDPALLTPVLGVRESYLDAAFNEVTTAYGSFDGYLRKGLGLDRATELKLRQRLTGT